VSDTSRRMWTLVLVAAAVGVVQGQGFNLERNISALWERIHELEDRTIHVHVHGGRVQDDHHDSHEGSHDHDDVHDSHEDHDHDDHGDHDEHHGENDEHIHIHIHGGGVGGFRGRDMYHKNPLPGAHRIPVDYDHGVCHFKPGSINLSGNIYLRQDFMGDGPVEMHFELEGFSSGHAHAHRFTVHRYGNAADQCAHVGHVFTPPHRNPARERGRHGGRDEPDAHNEVEDHTHDHSEEGVLGTLECDDSGSMHLHQTFDSVSIIGFHSIIGRTIVVQNVDESDDTILGCCVIGWNDGSHFGDENPAWLRGEHEEHEH